MNTMSTIDVIEPVSAAVDLASREDEAGVEFDGANWVEKPMGSKASAVGMTIGRLFGNEVVTTRAGVVFGSDQAYRCYPDSPAKFRKPDVSFVARDRLPADWEESGMLSIPADLAVEVVSPNDLHYDVEAKVDEYLAAGFGTVWVVNPVRKTVVIHRVGQQPTWLRAGDEITGEPFLPGFRCKVGAFFE